MDAKRASLVINPRTGQNLAKITDVLAVLAAAGWKTKLGIKEYGGQSLELAEQAAQGKSDLVIAYGGDGTLNQTVNGVMNHKKRHSIVGVIPGGTANVWAGEIGIPLDPVKAALALVGSKAHAVDVGHVDIERPLLPEFDAHAQNGSSSTKKTKLAKGKASARHHFLLMAGLGIDAAVMGNVSKPLKYRLGKLAVGVSAAKELPEQRPFPVEVRSQDNELLWQGEAIQIVIGNTRRYANVTEMTPDAYIDDGILDVCIITAGDPLSTFQQIASLLLRRKPDNVSAEFVHGAHLRISVPAHVPLQLDGSAAKLKDYLSKQDYQALQQVGGDQAQLTYRFDALPRALNVAIPTTYNNELFEHARGKEAHTDEQQASADEHSMTGLQHHTEEVLTQPASQLEPQEEHERQEQTSPVLTLERETAETATALLENTREVAVVGKVADPERPHTYIIAGRTKKVTTGELKPVAVVANEKTLLINSQGARLPFTALEELHEDAVIAVEGKQSKRGVIHAVRLVL